MKVKAKNKRKENYILINKSIFFPHSGILAIADLHIGYEQMLKNIGVNFPFNQFKESIEDIKKIIDEVKSNPQYKSKKYVIKKIVICGDLKHHFNFERSEKYEVRDFLKFLESYTGLEEKDIILIKGNHEKIELDSKKYRDYYIDKKDCVGFTHGDKLFLELFDKSIKTIVMGHLHPSITLSDKPKIKKEKYKCFLIGKWKSKKVIILPSFFHLIKGSEVLSTKEYASENKDGDFTFIPRKQLDNFEVYIVGENKDGDKNENESKNKVYDFGVLKKLERLN